MCLSLYRSASRLLPFPSVPHSPSPACFEISLFSSDAWVVRSDASTTGPVWELWSTKNNFLNNLSETWQTLNKLEQGTAMLQMHWSVMIICVLVSQRHSVSEKPAWSQNIYQCYENMLICEDNSVNGINYYY